jgi:hypothetical protein
MGGRENLSFKIKKTSGVAFFLGQGIEIHWKGKILG